MSAMRDGICPHPLLPRRYVTSSGQASSLWRSSFTSLLLFRNIPEAEAVDRLQDLIREHGKWVDRIVALNVGDAVAILSHRNAIGSIYNCAYEEFFARALRGYDSRCWWLFAFQQTGDQREAAIHARCRAFEIRFRATATGDDERRARARKSKPEQPDGDSVTVGIQRERIRRNRFCAIRRGTFIDRVGDAAA